MSYVLAFVGGFAACLLWLVVEIAIWPERSLRKFQEAVDVMKKGMGHG